MKPASNDVRRARPLLGTFVEIAVAGASTAGMNAAVDAAFGAVADVHGLMSFHESTSDVSRLNRLASVLPVAVNPWTYRVLDTALDLYRRSGGTFDIAIAPTLQALGLLPHDPGEAPSPIAAGGSDAIELLPDHRVRFRHPGIKVDLGGIAKGFAVDRALEILHRHGVPRALVNAGGDMAAFGQDAAADPVYIRDPRDPRAMYCSTLRDEAIATSGGRLDLVHASFPSGSAIIEPRSRRPSHAIVGATVRAPTCMIADALTKIVMIMGKASAALLEHCDASAMFVSAAGHIHVTGDWPEAVHFAA
jgi:thiamine biosynthesis lipoprotein